jgi:hypothetical protein
MLDQGGSVNDPSPEIQVVKKVLSDQTFKILGTNFWSLRGIFHKTFLMIAIVIDASPL